jgi:hypothetical protein
VEGSGRAFQLLLEVKVDSDFHEVVLDGEPLLQPDAYAVAWRKSLESGPAEVRRVATLTKKGPGLDEADPWRRAELTWSAVSTMLHESLRDKHFDAGMTRIAEEFRDAVRVLILRPGPDAADILNAHRIGEPLIAQLSAKLLSEITGARGRQQTQLRADHVSRYVQLPGRDYGPVTLWLLATPSGGRYALPGDPAGSVCIQIYGPERGQVLAASPALRAEEAGFSGVRDNDGWPGHRCSHSLPLELDQDSLTKALAELWSDVLRLRSVGLV